MLAANTQREYQEKRKKTVSPAFVCLGRKSTLKAAGGFKEKRKEECERKRYSPRAPHWMAAGVSFSRASEKDARFRNWWRRACWEVWRVSDSCDVRLCAGQVWGWGLERGGLCLLFRVRRLWGHGFGVGFGFEVRIWVWDHVPGLGMTM